MTLPPHIALMAALDLPPADGESKVPDWIHLSPLGRVETLDGRGPYDVADAQAIIQASFEKRGDLEIDVNHASFLSAPNGGDAPARGWIVEMQAREDGIWGRVNWTEEGRRLVASRAYRRISPVFQLDQPGGSKVVGILNASLVNRNNLRGLAALNAEQETSTMNEVLAKLKKMLGLADDAEDDEIWRSLSAVIDAAAAERAKNASGAAMQAAMGEIAAALGVATTELKPEAVVAAAKAATAKPGDGKVIASLQAEITNLGGQLNAVLEKQSRDRASAFVDGEYKRGRQIPSDLRDHYIAMHMQDPDRIEKELGAFPIIGGRMIAGAPPAAKDGEIALQSAYLDAARLLGIPVADYAATLKAEREAQEAR